MKTKSTIKILKPIVTAIVMSSSALMMQHASAEISGNVALTSDYYFRGVSQTMNDGAIQGGFDWSHDSGVYAGVWASNVDFGTNKESLEVDTYLGYGGEIAGIGYDIGWLRYNYDDVTGTGSEPDEYHISLSKGDFSIGYYYSPDWFSNMSAQYVNLSGGYSLPADVSLSASIGYSFGDAYNNSEYTDYKIGVSKDFAGVTFDLSYVGNDSNNTAKTWDNKFIVTISKSF